jgi:8-oxo-dGTP diphosphatase
MPYRIACLCDLRDAQGRVLLLRRIKSPNLGLCSPIGGKLDVAHGESPAQCAQREILEEAGIHVPLERIRLIGLVAETAFEGRGHWLMFVYRVLGAVEVEPRDMREGRLDWFTPQEIEAGAAAVGAARAANAAGLPNPQSNASAQAAGPREMKRSDYLQQVRTNPVLRSDRDAGKLVLTD